MPAIEGLGTPKVENLDAYEREKIERTLRDAEHATEVIRIYLEMIRFCDEQGIKIEGRTSLEKLRFPDGPAEPDSDLHKIAVMFENGQAEIARNLTQAQNDEIVRTHKATTTQAS